MTGLITTPANDLATTGPTAGGLYGASVSA